MHYLVDAIILVVSFLVTVRYGPGRTFVWVFVPVLLLLGAVRPVELPKLPDINSTMAVSYGVLMGMIVVGRVPAIRLHLIDFLVLAISISTILSAVFNGVFWTLVSAIGSEALRWLVPYYMARLAFREAELRTQLAKLLCGIAITLGMMGLIEFRLWPNFFSRMLVDSGLSIAVNDMAMGRFGFFRAMVTGQHPIDFGNMGLLMACAIPMMAATGGLRMRSLLVVGGVLASLAMVVESISFSSFFGTAAAVTTFLVLRYVRFSELLLLPGVVAAVIGGFVFTNNLLSKDLETLRPADNETNIAGSYYVRVLIVQNSWNSYGKSAGLIGYGDDNLNKKELQLDSVDNSYMLFLMRRGWLHLTLRIVLAFAIAYLGMQMLRKARTPAARIPPAAAMAALFGTMMSMYTVWFGFIYAILWTLLLAMTVTMRQMIAGRVANIPAPSRGLGVPTTPYGLPPRTPGLAYPARMA